jgi:5-methylcytosine-specific restriction endonuclease McrA
MKTTSSDQPRVYKICPECLKEAHDRRFYECEPFEPPSDMIAMFPASLRTWNRHCPRHQAGLESDVLYIARDRFINVEWFDVYDAEGNHVCRACGAPMLTKKGKRCAALRWCKRGDDEHQKWRAQTYCNFAQDRIDYVYELADKQIPLIESKYADKIKNGELKLDDGKRRGSKISYYVYHGGHIVVLCEQCGELATFNHSYCHGIVHAQVHHKNPVCHVTVADVMSIFDFNNFKLLCMKCHGKAHPWRKHPAPPSPKYVTLDTFFK